MGMNWGAVGAGYQGYQEEQRRLAEDARRAADEQRRTKADQRATDDAAFVGEERDRQRREWTIEDAKKAAAKADRAELAGQQPATTQAAPAPGDKARVPAAEPTLEQQVDQLLQPPADKGFVPPAAGEMARNPDAPTLGKPAPPGAPQAFTVGGTAQRPASFHSTLALENELLRRAHARGDVPLEVYAQKQALLKKMKSEGIHDALELMSQGRYEDAIAQYNSMGAMNGAKVVSGQQGETTVNGRKVPTHFVTIENADGTRTPLDVAQTRYQLLEYEKQLADSMQGAQLDAQREHYKGVREDNKAQRDQHASDAAAGRAVQNAHLRLARDQFEAGSPMGLIQAKEKALGQSLSAEQKAAMLGVDTMAPATRVQLNSLLKEQDQLSNAMSKAESDPMWNAEAAGYQNMLKRSSTINMRMNDLLGAKAGKPSSDPRGFLSPATGGATAPNPASAPGSIPAVAAAASPAIGARPAVNQAAPGGVPSTSERDRRMELFNNTVGGVSQLRASALAARSADLGANFDSQLGKIQRGLSRQEAQAVLTWFDQQTEAGNLSNQQLKQVRDARKAAGL